MPQLISPNGALVGLFSDLATAEAAMKALQEAGFSEDNFIVTPQALQPAPAIKDTEASRSAGGGALAGTVFGIMAGVLMGFMTTITPGTPPYTDSLSTLLGMTFLGAGIGAAGGSLMGALSGSKVSKAASEQFNLDPSTGSYVILMEQSVPEEVEKAKQVLKPLGQSSLA
jgi:F0F1-type ATP synthase assembly protein I